MTSAVLLLDKADSDMIRKKFFAAQKLLPLFLILLCLVVTLKILLTPTLFVLVKGKILYASRAYDGQSITINFMHSVQKTPVEEHLLVQDNAFRLISTKYQSFGVGLPFLAEEGNFHYEDGRFVMDEMNRNYDSLSLRTGLGTKLRLTIDGTELPLYKKFPDGTKIDVFVAPYGEIFYR